MLSFLELYLSWLTPKIKLGISSDLPGDEIITFLAPA